MKWIAITICLLAASCYWMYKESFAAESDIYINRLVYLRKNNALFTGALKTVDNASQAHQSFCNGIPCGTYAEQQNGGSYISKGEYIALDKLQAIKRAFPTDTITVSLWQAGGDIASDPYYLSVTVLKDNAFLKLKAHYCLVVTKS